MQIISFGDYLHEKSNPVFWEKYLQFMQIVSIGDNLYERSNPVFWEKYFNVVCLKFYPECLVLKRNVLSDTNVFVHLHLHVFKAERLASRQDGGSSG